MYNYVFEPRMEFDKNDRITPNDISSDYGFYGETGSCKNHGLTDVKCKCGGNSILFCEYDDTPGFKETVYMFKCDTCENKTIETCIIDTAIKKWNHQSYAVPTEGN